MTFDQLIQLAGAVIGPLVGAVGAYVAIRSDLAVLRTKIEHHDQALETLTRRADSAHERIDGVLR
jgi:hypothetical protein